MDKIFTVLIFLFLSITSLLAQKNNTVEREVNVFFDSNELKVNLYPNPTTEYLYVELDNNRIEEANFELHSIIGSRIKIDPELVSNNKYRISVKEFPRGYYFLILKDELTRYKKAFKFLKN